MTIDLEWMAWTAPTAIFFGTIAACLVGLTIWQIASPSIPRRGFLPMTTTRGDRFFMALMVAAFLQIGWLMVSDPESALWIPLGAAVVAGAGILRWA